MTPCNYSSVADRQHHKLSKRYFGPFQIKEQVAYRIKLSDTSNIQSIFHESLLKPHKGDPTEDLKTLPPNPVDNNSITQPAIILIKETLTGGLELTPQVLVQRKSLPIEELHGKI